MFFINSISLYRGMLSKYLFIKMQICLIIYFQNYSTCFGSFTILHGFQDISGRWLGHSKNSLMKECQILCCQTGSSLVIFLKNLWCGMNIFGRVVLKLFPLPQWEVQLHSKVDKIHLLLLSLSISLNFDQLAESWLNRV